MKYGAIDIGTNSIRLLIAQIENGEIVKSFKTLQITRIGENVDHTGMISTAAMDRTIKALKQFMMIIEEEGLSSVPIIATSAVRDAKNKADFLEQVKIEVNANIQIISGEREAELGFLGVQKGFKQSFGDVIVVDIGGGSTELIIGSQTGIHHLISLNMGAVRMTEKYLYSVPVSIGEIDTLISALDSMLKPTVHKIKQYKIDRMIGIGGTATTLAAVAQNMAVYDPSKIHNFYLEHEKVMEILKLFIGKSLEERKQIPGLQPKRADVITAGTVILNIIMTLLEVQGLWISEYDNLEGLVFEQVNNK